jgi:Predicted Zn-dependent protease (DUF2268)
MLHVLSAIVLAVLTQSSGGMVLPVYRDLVKDRPFSEAHYYDRCGAGAGPLELLKPTDRATRQQLVRDVDAANVPAIAERALARAAAALPGATVNVCLFMGELSRGLPYLDGVGGVALGGGRIKLILHPQPNGLYRVPYTVAHEYHHEVEGLLGPGGFSPLDIVIREGKADHFAVGLYPDLRPPHTQPLTNTELAIALHELDEYERTQASAATVRRDFMIGKNPRVLMWPGYRLGFEMVELYFKGRKVTPLDVVQTPAGVIRAYYGKHGRR